MKTQPNPTLRSRINLEGELIARAYLHFSPQGGHFELPNGSSESTTICRPLLGGAEAASENLAKRFHLEFKPFAHCRKNGATINGPCTDRTYDQLIKRSSLYTTFFNLKTIT